MTPEAKARQQIDQKLESAGWVIQDMKQLNLGAGLGVAVREYPTDTGPADYVLFVNRTACGVIEAKKDSAGENLIFRDLIAKKRTPAFAFQLAYRMGAGQTLRHIHIDADPDRKKDVFLIRVADAKQVKQNELTHSLLDFGDDADKSPQGEPIKLTAFVNADTEYLPRYVFSYYSGESPRMHEVFRPYLESYDGKLRNGEDPGLKRLFYAMPVHSQFVLLAFLIQQSEVVRAFLDDHLGLDPDEGIESVLFVLRQPPWKSKAEDGDPRFWNARGVVRDFLSRLYDIALAPIEVSRRVSTSIWNKETLQFKYLYVKDIAALRRLVGNQAPAQFFRDLESTYVSELIEEVRTCKRRHATAVQLLADVDEGKRLFELATQDPARAPDFKTVAGRLRRTIDRESPYSGDMHFLLRGQRSDAHPWIQELLEA